MNMRAAETESDQQGRVRRLVGMKLLTMDSAPRDGTSFLCIQVVTVASNEPPFYKAHAFQLRRVWTPSDRSGNGYWQAGEGQLTYSVADNDVLGAFWMPSWGTEVIGVAPV